MENRQNVVADYLKLHVMLNRTNLKSNQKTEVEFSIVNSSNKSAILFSTLKGVRNAKFFELCKKEKDEDWISSNYSGLIALENFCANFLNSNLTRNSQKYEIEEVLGQLRNELRSLGISR